MFLRLPRRFSTRAMLVFVAVVALAAWAIRDYAKLQTARDRFQYISASYEAGRVLAEDFVAESKALMAAESSSIWVSDRRAIADHIERLTDLLKKVQSPLSESRASDVERRVAVIRQELAQYAPIDTATPAGSD